MKPTVLTTLLASSLALLGLAVGKDSKVSEFRQQWIDGLRADVSEFLASVQQLFGFRVAERYQKATIEDKARHTALLRTNKLASRIRLRLDPKKDGSKKLVNQMIKLRNIAHDGELREMDLLNQAKVVEECTSDLLEEAWKRVKRGEPKYRWCFWISVVFVVGSLIALIMELIQRSSF